MADASNIVQQNLLDAKAKLVAQEQEILAELERIRKGIESIETTIEVVCSGTMPTLAKPASTDGDKAEKPAENVSTPAENNGKSSVATSPTPARKTNRRGRTKIERAKDSAKPAKSSAKSAPSSGRASKRNNTGWQSFLHDEFKDMALTEVVETVFSRSPNTAMSSSDLIDKIFTSEIPKAERTSARDRLLNILSIGVSENKWYRVKPGQYSISRDAQ